MSVLLAIANTVAATPVPTPTPEIVVKTVEVIPAWVGQLQNVLVQLAQLGLLVIPGAVASKLHDFANPKLGTWGNALLLFGYSAVLGVLSIVAAGQLHLAHISFTPESVGTAFLVVLGAASSRYAIYKARTTPSETKAVEGSTAVPTQF